MVDLLAIWVFLFGVYPLADPGHGADTMLSVLDILLHIGAAILLISRWRLVRRTHEGGA